MGVSDFGYVIGIVLFFALCVAAIYGFSKV